MKIPDPPPTKPELPQAKRRASGEYAVAPEVPAYARVRCPACRGRGTTNCAVCDTLGWLTRDGFARWYDAKVRGR